MTYFTEMASPIGRLLLTGIRLPTRAQTRTEGEMHVTGIYMRSPKHPANAQPEWQEHAEAFENVTSQLRQYFDGQRRAFELLTQAKGTPFQKKVWKALLEIPYGETWTYGQLAQHIGQPTASRAVGMANGRNPLSIIVPCHRVIGASGELTGYGGGIERKRWLLAHESAA